MSAGPNVIGLDLSITATGVAYEHAPGDLTSECWKMAAKLGDRRLESIADNVSDLIAGADLFVIEDLPTHAHGAGITGMVHGAVRCVLLHAEIPYVLVTPATLKKYATGKGNAGKPDMAVALYKRAGIELADDNQVDAAWLRYAGLDALGHPAIDLPEAQKSTLYKVKWPIPTRYDGEDK